VVGNQAASTDMGNVSRLVPSIHPMMSIDSLPAVNHQAEFASASVSPAGDRAVVDAALVLASTAVDLATTRGPLTGFGRSSLTPPRIRAYGCSRSRSSRGMRVA
jgi:hypothetical protein